MYMISSVIMLLYVGRSPRDRVNSGQKEWMHGFWGLGPKVYAIY